MNYENIVFAKFIDRPNRFVAHVDLDGQTETVHVKNTGRCRELLLPGSTVVLSKAANPARKTKYDLIAVIKEGLGWVNIDSQVPNACVKEWLEAQKNESDIRLIFLCLQPFFNAGIRHLTIDIDPSQPFFYNCDEIIFGFTGGVCSL